jgi:hypothetical protein
MSVDEQYQRALLLYIGTMVRWGSAYPGACGKAVPTTERAPHSFHMRGADCRRAALRAIMMVAASISIGGLVHAKELRPVPFVNYPRELTVGEWHYAIGASLTLLPRAVVEEEIRQLPLIQASGRYGLGSGFSAYGQVATVYLTNVATAGVWWSFSKNNVALALTEAVSFWFGVADMEGFDTKAMGLITMPGVNVGVELDGYQLSLHSEALIAISQHTYFGSASVGRIAPALAGVSFTLTAEQRLWNATCASFAVRTRIAQPNYQVWLAFSVQDRWLLFPEFQVGLLF